MFYWWASRHTWPIGRCPRVYLNYICRGGRQSNVQGRMQIRIAQPKSVEHFGRHLPCTRNRRRKWLEVLISVRQCSNCAMPSCFAQIDLFCLWRPGRQFGSRSPSLPSPPGEGKAIHARLFASKPEWFERSKDLAIIICIEEEFRHRGGEHFSFHSAGTWARNHSLTRSWKSRNFSPKTDPPKECPRRKSTKIIY